MLSNSLKPEDSLQVAINDMEELKPTKTSFWEKVGFTDKKREDALVEKAHAGLQ